jgi:outer membrane protein assembly factor BamB
MAILAIAGTAAFFGWSLVGEPWADFLIALAIVEAGLFAWTALAKDLSFRQRTSFVGILLIAPLVALSFTDLSPFSAIQELFRRRPDWPESKPPPPKEFNHEYPQSEIVPDLAKRSPTDWPGYLGADRTGRVASPVELATDWKSRPPKLLWQHPIGGGGGSSSAIVGEFLVSHEQRGQWETVACYELRTGKQCWEHREDQYSHDSYCGSGPKTTPTIADGLVVTLGGQGRLLCLDGATGKRNWKVDLHEMHKANPPGFGITASPLVVDGLVVAGIGGEKASLVAYELSSGRFRWASGTSPASYSSPMLATLAGVRQIVWFNHDGTVGCNPNDGRFFWSVSWSFANRNNVCQPLLFSSTGSGEPDSLLVSAGDDVGCSAFVIERKDEGLKPRELWTNKNLKLKFSTAIQVRDMAVGLDERILSAIELKTGKRRWKHSERFGYGQIIATGDRLIVQTEEGKIVFGEARNDDFHKLGEFQTILKQSWNAPALAGDVLVVRGQEVLAAYQLPSTK